MVEKENEYLDTLKSLVYASAGIPKVFVEKPVDIYSKDDEYEGNGFLTTQEKCRILLQKQGRLRKKRK